MVIKLKEFEKYIFLFIVGGIGYGIMEISFRGYTHWSMIITGGSAFLCLYIISESLTNTHILVKALLGAVIITTLEFTVGLIVNIVFNMNVWDYTNTPTNLLGIISLPFSICWYVISYVVLGIFNLVNKIKAKQKPYIPLLREN